MAGKASVVLLVAFFIANFSVAMSALCTSSICHYIFKIYKARTMTYAPNADDAYNVELGSGGQLKLVPNAFHTSIPWGVKSQFSNPAEQDKVITGDGFPRNIFLVNGQFPGPTIEVQKGSMIVVKVDNLLNAEALSIHWHGMEMYGTPGMDGTAYLTQCPILPAQSFTYTFRADTVGTHWYHSHSATMRLDAFLGFIIVRDGGNKRGPKPFEFTMSVMEWLHVDYDTMIITAPGVYHRPGTGEIFLNEDNADFSIDGSEISSLVFHSVLVNGRGRHNGQKYPLTLYKVRKNSNYRFRMANTGAEAPWEISIDSHSLDIVALDGSPIEPITVDSFLIFPGETLDFTIRTNQGNYGSRFWIRVVMFKHGKGPNVQYDPIPKEGRAVLEYSNQVGEFVWRSYYDPSSNPKVCSPSNLCKVYNCPVKGFPTNFYKECISINEARYEGNNFNAIISKYGLSTPPYQVREMFLNFGFMNGASVNGISYAHPRKPLIFGPNDYYRYITPCNGCRQCKCTHIIDLPLGRTNQFVLTNYHPSNVGFAHHPIHFHGHNFAVLKVGYPPFHPGTGRRIGSNSDVVCTDYTCSGTRWRSGAPTLNLDKTPIKDTMVVPAGGYAVIRFRSTMPGYWFMHCHQDEHFLKGMIVVFREGNDNQIHVPHNFPQCGDFP